MPQHMEALRRANEVRAWLTEQKRAVEAGDVELWCELVQSADERLKSVVLLDFLCWLPKVGEVKARRMINEAFPWATPRTETRAITRIGLTSALRLSHLARESQPNSLAIAA